MQRRGMLILVIVLVLVAADVFAGGSLPWDGPLDTVLRAFSGGTIRLIAIAGILIAAVVLMINRQQGVPMLFWIIGGASLGIGAANFANIFTRGASGALF